MGKVTGNNAVAGITTAAAENANRAADISMYAQGAVALGSSSGPFVAQDGTFMPVLSKLNESVADSEHNSQPA